MAGLDGSPMSIHSRSGTGSDEVFAALLQQAEEKMARTFEVDLGLAQKLDQEWNRALGSPSGCERDPEWRSWLRDDQCARDAELARRLAETTDEACQLLLDSATKMPVAPGEVIDLGSTFSGNSLATTRPQSAALPEELFVRSCPKQIARPCFFCVNDQVPTAKLGACAHAGCRACVRKIFISASEGGSLPAKCCETLSMELAKEVLDSSEYLVLLDRTEQKSARYKMFCPRCTCFLNLDPAAERICDKTQNTAAKGIDTRLEDDTPPAKRRKTSYVYHATSWDAAAQIASIGFELGSSSSLLGAAVYLSSTREAALTKARVNHAQCVLVCELSGVETSPTFPEFARGSRPSEKHPVVKLQGENVFAVYDAKRVRVVHVTDREGNLLELGTHTATARATTAVSSCRPAAGSPQLQSTSSKSCAKLTVGGETLDRVGKLDRVSRTETHQGYDADHTAVFPADGATIPCPGCFEYLCLHCRDQAHAGQTCSEFQKKRLDERDGDSALQKTAARRGWKQCQQCLITVERSDGCNHMTCNCGHQFCYRCGADWKPARKCECPLFTEADLVGDEEEEDERCASPACRSADGYHHWVWRRYRHDVTHSGRARNCDHCGEVVGKSCFNCRTCNTKRCPDCHDRGV
mmetsp:Transcript_56365/g.150737  ORF Transcript_56365/g.150737 Transcript_56365/m.150737 type:complete len:638 (-) Transcript_56365:145-2058(-)